MNLDEHIEHMKCANAFIRGQDRSTKCMFIAALPELLHSSEPLEGAARRF